MLARVNRNHCLLFRLVSSAHFPNHESQKEEQNPRSASEEECVQDFGLARKKSNQIGVREYLPDMCQVKIGEIG